VGPQYDPSAYSMTFTAQIVGYGDPKSACTSLEPTCYFLGVVQVMVLGAKFGRRGRWPMGPLRGTYSAWPMIG